METQEINRLLRETTARCLNLYIWSERILDCSVSFYLLSILPYVFGATRFGSACTATGVVGTLLAIIPTYLRFRLQKQMQPLFERHPNYAERDRIIRDAVRDYRRDNP